MPLNLTKIQNTSRTISVKTDQGSIEIHYYPNKYTPELFEEVAEKFNNAELSATGQTGYVLEKIIKSWDITFDNAEGESVPYPVTLENIMALPVNLLREIDKAIEDDLNPTKPSGGRR